MLCEYGSVYMLFGGLSVCGLSAYVCVYGCACAPVWIRACERACVGLFLCDCAFLSLSLYI